MEPHVDVGKGILFPPPPLLVAARTLGELNLPGHCDACTWNKLRYREIYGKSSMPYSIPMPGIFSSIDSFSKHFVHAFVDAHRMLPSSFGFEQQKVDRMGKKGLNWKQFQRYDSQTGITLTGVPDDIVVFEDGTYAILDYKTARYTATQDALLPLYEVQLNVYAHIAAGFVSERLPTRLALIYFEPQNEVDVAILKGREDAVPSLPFTVRAHEIALHPGELLPPLMQRLRSIYDMVTPPQHRASCTEESALDVLLKLHHHGISGDGVALTWN